jgi:hypothetical protein
MGLRGLLHTIEEGCDESPIVSQPAISCGPFRHYYFLGFILEELLLLIVFSSSLVPRILNLGFVMLDVRPPHMNQLLVRKCGNADPVLDKRIN